MLSPAPDLTLSFATEDETLLFSLSMPGKARSPATGAARATT
jgi:hypothetical protein